MIELRSWSAWSAFASLQATAKNFAGLNNARTLIREVKHIRFQRYKQITDDLERDQLSTEAREEYLQNSEIRPAHLCAAA